MTSVVVTRDERDALYDEIVLELGGGLDDIASSLKHGSGQKVRDLRENAERAMRLLDDLGWDRADDRTVYRLTMAPDQLAIYARSRIEQTEGSLRDSSLTLAEVSAGGDPWRGSRAHLGARAGQLRDDVAELRNTVDRDLDLLAACRSILARLTGEEIGPAWPARA